MKKTLFALLIMYSLNANTQKQLEMAVLGGAVIDYSLSDIYTFNGSCVSLNTFFPFKAGFQLAYPINDHLALTGGYHFYYRYLEVNMYTANVGNIFTGTRLMNSEIPLFLKYNHIIKSQEHLSIFGELGTAVDLMYISNNIFGRYQNDIIGTLAITNGFTYTLDVPGFTFPALYASLGFSTMIGEKGTIDVLVSYHMHIKKNIKHTLYDYFHDHIQNPFLYSYEYEGRIAHYGLEIRYKLPWGIRLKGE